MRIISNRFLSGLLVLIMGLGSMGGVMAGLGLSDVHGAPAGAQAIDCHNGSTQSPDGLMDTEQMGHDQSCEGNCSTGCCAAALLTNNPQQFSGHFPSFTRPVITTSLSERLVSLYRPPRA